MRKKHEIIFDFIPMSSCTAAWNFFTFMILDFSSFVSIENHKRTNIQEPIEWFVLMVFFNSMPFSQISPCMATLLAGEQSQNCQKLSVWFELRKYETSKGPRGDGNKHWLCHAIIHYCSEKLPILLHIPYQFKKLSRCHIGVYRLWPSYNCVNACSL